MKTVDILQLLQGVKGNAPQWVARCPAHDDRNPSLGIRQGEDGRTLLTCRSGNCSLDAITKALGITIKDLFENDDSTRSTNPPRSQSSRDSQPEAKKVTQSMPTYQTLNQLQEAAKGHRNTKALGAEPTFHLHTNEEGFPLLCVCRWDSPDKTQKRFSQASFDLEKKTWSFTASTNYLKPVYRLPTIKGASIVVIVEGEKCADALGKLFEGQTDFAFTTLAGGANTDPKKFDLAPLIGKEIYLSPDNDQAGEVFVKNIIGELLRLGQDAGKVRLIDPKQYGFAPHPENEADKRKDVADWIEQEQGNKRTNAQIQDSFDGILKEARVIDPKNYAPKEEAKAPKRVENQTEGRKPKGNKPRSQATRIEPNWTSAKDVKEAAPPEWIFENRLARGMCTTLSSWGGKGKSFISASLAACLSTGSGMPDGTPAIKGRTVIISSEDSKEVWVARLKTSDPNCDLGMIDFYDGEKVFLESDDGEQVEEIGFTLNGLKGLESFLKDRPDTVLLVIDPISSYLAGADSNSQSQVRPLVDALIELTRRLNFATLIVSHHSKGNHDNADALNTGSTALTNAMRIVLHVFDDPNNKGHQILVAGKTNVGPKADAIRYRIESRWIQEQFDPTKRDVGRIVWGDMVQGYNADDCIKDIKARDKARESKPARGDGEPSRKLKDVMDWVRAFLTPRPRFATDLFSAGEMAGFKELDIRDALAEVNAENVKEKGKRAGKSIWRLRGMGDEYNNRSPHAPTPTIFEEGDFPQ